MNIRTSEQAAARSITDAVAASVLEAEFQRVKDELEASRKQSVEATRESERTREALGRTRIASLGDARDCERA